ncbi:platelet-activating factor acetylhydrolase IB subunit [Paludisphaera rhizosphaerae]|uniref:platelet-activating factor acetylhydrolase IB subunit n=1 Tax=Paludisphaera rhizosphaerae TaxID=2711216 RepID=UPI0013EA3082|nr:platelet-activating factor acetylhydrolase IB subunit [Paludisphaera rhizosphaerae]
MLRKSFGSLPLAAALAVSSLIFSAGEATAQAIPAVTPAPRDEKWMKTHEALLEKSKQAREENGATLVFLGDSITAGWRQNEAWQKFYAPRKALNLGIGGDRTQHVLWRLENGEVEGLKPKAVVLMIGTNNSGSDPVDAIAAGVKAIVADLRSRLPETDVLLLAVFPRGEKPELPVRDKLKQVNAEIAKLDGGKVHYLDIGETFLEKDGTLSKEIMPDFLHLTPKGYERWAEAIEPSLKKILGE